MNGTVLKRLLKQGLALGLLLCFATGCWNLTEPDQLAYITAAGLDVAPDGRIEISSQIAIPSALNVEQNAGSGNEKSFLVVSAEGKNVMDAGRTMQTGLSRALFYEHRQAIVIGQRMAQRGVGDLIDMFVRNPKSEMRSTVAVVRDGKAKDLLNVKPRFDAFSGLAILRVQATDGTAPYYYRSFLADALSEGAAPLLPAFRLDGGNGFACAGAAVLDNSANLKLAGYLEMEEAALAYWIVGRQSALSVTSHLEDGQGTVTLRLQHLRRRFRVRLTKDGKPSIEVRLIGGGAVVENSSRLDPSKSGDRRTLERELSAVAQKSAQRMVEKVQRDYRTDAFGFGERIHRRYPRQWKTLKRDWKRNFAELPVTVRVTLHAKDPGQTTSAMKRFF